MDVAAFGEWISARASLRLAALRMAPTPVSFRILLSTCPCSDGSSVGISLRPEFAGALATLRLSLYRNGLKFEVPPGQERPRSDEFARGIILGREVARVNGIEFLEQRQIRARNLHVHQIIHGHPRLSQDFFFAIQQHFGFVFYLFWNFARLRINPNPPRKVQRIAR